MVFFLVRGDFLSVFSAMPSVHCRGPRFASLPHFTFIALTSDRSGDLLDLEETLLTAPTDNANLGKFMTAVLGTGTPAATRHIIALPDGGKITELRRWCLIRRKRIYNF
jgi:hypothetical protein